MEEKRANLLSISSLDECEQVFREHVEPKLEYYSESKDKLFILRICIELLDRLKGSPHHHLAGRVSIFLAKVLNLFDQSGLNKTAEFDQIQLPETVIEHLQRIRTQSAEEDKNLAISANHDMEEGETLSDDDSNDVIPKGDANKIYERFWKVQNFLHQPNQLYDKNTWFTFRTYIDTLICTMEKQPATTQVWDLKSSFMVDPRTLILQLNDIYTRRTVLLQILIVLQYLDMPVDSRPESMILDKLQLNWIVTVKRKIYGLLDSMPNPEDGRKFLEFVRIILKREEMWSKWKNNKCYPPKKPVVDDEDEMLNMRGTYRKIRKISNELSNARPYKMHVVGSQDMCRLWNMREDINVQPNLSNYLDIPLEKQDELFKSPNYSYRVLRLLRKSKEFFIPTLVPVGTLENYLKETTKSFSNTQ